MPDDDRIASILGEWQERRDRGEQVDPEDVIAEHPDVAEELRVKFEALSPLDATRAGESRSASPTRLRELPLDRYADFRPAGEGGMGIVYWAIDTDLNREVAFKVIRPGVQEGDTTTPAAPVELSAPAKDTPASQAFETLKQRFLQEAWVTGGLSHPGIVPVYELGETPEGVPYYTMRFVRGERTLADAIGDAKDADIEARLELLEPFLKICDTLSYAHAKGVIHRDLKPDNIALGEFGEVVVIDWGLAKIKDRADVAHERWQDRIQEYRDATDLRTVASAMGTPGYMAPEAAKGQAEAMDARSDVYSLGAILFQVLTGRLPFEFTTFGELVMQVLKEDPPAATAVAEGIPKALSDLCARCLSREADARPRDADEIAKTIRQWQSRSAMDREVEGLVRDAESAFAVAGEREGDARIRELDRVMAATSRVLSLRPDHGRAIALQAEVACLREQGTREREQAARRRLLMRVGTAVGVLVVAASVLVGWVLNERRREADQLRAQADEATSRAVAERDAKSRALTRAIGMRLAGQSTLVLEDSPDLALLLAIEAAEHDGGAPATNALLEALEAHDPRHLRTLAVPAVDIHLEGVSTDGRVVVTTLFDWEDYRFRGWDLDTGVVLWDLERGQKTYVCPAGRIALTFASTGAAEVLETSTGRRTAVLEELRGPEGCWFSPDGRLVVSVDEEEGAGLWETATGKRVAWLDGAGLINSDLVVFSSDGGRVLTRHHHRSKDAEPSKVRFWSTEDGRLLSELGGIPKPTIHASFGPGGRRALLRQVDGAVLWDVDGGSELRRNAGPEAAGRRAALSPDGSIVALAGALGPVRLWDADTWALVATLEGPAVQVSELLFDPSGRVLAIGRRSGEVELREVHTGKVLATLRAHGERVSTILFSPEGKHLLTSGDGGTVRTWSMDPGRSYPLVIAPRTREGTVLLGPEGRHVLVQDPSEKVRLLEAATGETVAEWAAPEGVVVSQLLPGDRVIGVSSAEKTIHVLRATTGEEVTSFPVVPGNWAGIPVRCTEAALLNGGQIVAALLHFRSPEVPEDMQSRVFVWDTTTGSIPFGGGDTLIASPADDRILWGEQVYDLEALEPICELDPHDDCLYVKGFSSDGKQISASGEDNSVRIHDAETGAEKVTMHGHRDWVGVVVFAPDGRRLLSGSDDRTARIWDVATGRELSVLLGHRGSIRDGCFDAAGARVLTCCKDDGTVRVWDADTGEALAVLDIAAFEPASARFTKDGLAVAVLGKQKGKRLGARVLVWPLEPLPYALADRPRALSFEERAQHVPEDVTDDERRTRRIVGRARQQVARLRREFLLKDRLLAHIETDPALASEERDAALAAARLFEDDQYRLHEASWEVALSHGESTEAYEVAAARARRACEMNPEDADHLSALGWALYRTGAYDEALDVLARADAHNEGPGAAYISLAQALCHARLTRGEDARAAIARAADMYSTLFRRDETDPDAVCEEVATVVHDALDDPELADRVRSLPARMREGREAGRTQQDEAMRRAVDARRAEAPFVGFNGDAGASGGIAITGVIAGTPAEAAGLRPGDVIVGLGDTAVADFDAFRAAIASFEPADEVTLRVRRGDEELTLTLTLGRRGDFVR